MSVDLLADIMTGACAPTRSPESVVIVVLSVIRCHIVLPPMSPYFISSMNMSRTKLIQTLKTMK